MSFRTADVSEWHFRETKNAFFVLVENKNGGALKEVLINYIEKDSTILSDSWRVGKAFSDLGFDQKMPSNLKNSLSLVIKMSIL